MSQSNNPTDQGELKNYGRQHSSPTVIRVQAEKKEFNTQGFGKEDSSSTYYSSDLDATIFKYDIHPFSVFDRINTTSTSSTTTSTNLGINLSVPPPPKDLFDDSLSSALDQVHPFFSEARKKYQQRDDMYREQLEALTSGGKKKSEKEKIVQRSDAKVDKVCVKFC